MTEAEDAAWAEVVELINSAQFADTDKKASSSPPHVFASLSYLLIRVARSASVKFCYVSDVHLVQVKLLKGVHEIVVHRQPGFFQVCLCMFDLLRASHTGATGIFLPNRTM